MTRGPHSGPKGLFIDAGYYPAEANQLDAELGTNVRLKRRSLGVSQTELGKSVGLTFQQIQKYEKGSNRISFSMLVGIARALNCSPSDLIGQIGSTEQQPTSANTSTALRGHRVAELLEAFARIKSPALRRQTLQLVEQLSRMPIAVTDGVDDDAKASPGA